MSASRLSRLNDGLIEVERRLEILERINQSGRLAFGQILLDGDEGVLQIMDDDDNVIVEMNPLGIDFFQENAAGNTFNRYFDINDDLVAYNFFGSYGGNSSEFLQATVDTAPSANRIIYQSFEIDDVSSNRLAFLQFNYTYVANAFSSAGLDFGLDGAIASFRIHLNTSGGSGWIKIPEGASDPANPVDGSMYYNTSTGKLKIYESPSWVTVTTT